MTPRRTPAPFVHIGAALLLLGGHAPVLAQQGMTTAMSSVPGSRVGERQRRDEISTLTNPTARLNSRITSRVQSRLSARLDRNQQLPADASAAIRSATQQAQRTSGPR